MTISYDFSKTNDIAAVLTGLGAATYAYCFAGYDLLHSIGGGILGGLAVLGITGFSLVSAAAKAA